MISPVFLQLFLHAFSLFLYGDAVVIYLPDQHDSSLTTYSRMDDLQTLQAKYDQLNKKSVDLKKESKELEGLSSQLKAHAKKLQNGSDVLEKQAAAIREKSDQLRTESSLYQEQSSMLDEMLDSTQTESKECLSHANGILKEIGLPTPAPTPTQAPTPALTPRPTHAPPPVRIISKYSQTLWPRGNYALLDSKMGCPGYSDKPGLWKTGNYFFHTESSDGRYHNANRLSETNHMKNPLAWSGPKGHRINFFTLDLCIKRNYDEPKSPVWPKGTYCIFMDSANDTLDGFSPKYIYVDPEDDVRYGYRVSESIRLKPGNNLKRGVNITLLCREDGSPYRPIYLPKEYPFYLLKEKPTKRCQSVYHTEFTSEWFKIDNENDGKHNDIRIDMCYYTKRR